MPVKLTPKFVQRVWGCTDLSPWFPPQEAKTGEVWYTRAGSPILVKFIFTSADLSVQVHPDDTYAQKHNGECGKTEMWHILGAVGAAKIAAGFQRTTTVEELRAAVHDGSIQQMLRYQEVAPGDTHFIEAGVVHAIGRGITLCEIQQNCDVTYRLYDYGRPRELHLDDGLAMAQLGPYDSRRTLPVRSPFFDVDAVAISETAEYATEREELLVVLRGTIHADELELRQGEVLSIAAGERVILDAASSASALRVSIPD